jgi:hypothetical protein
LTARFCNKRVHRRKASRGWLTFCGLTTGNFHHSIARLFDAK